MRQAFFLEIALAISVPCISQAQSRAADTSFLREYAETRGFMLGRPVRPKLTPDGKFVLFLRSDAKSNRLRLFEFDVTHGTNREVLTPETVLKGAQEYLSPEEKARRERMRVTAGGFADYQLSEDGALVLLSLSGKLYIYDRMQRSVVELTTSPGTLVDPKLSPDGKKVAYVLNQDVFVYDLQSRKETAVTTGGTAAKTHGLAEFVAQEEMHRFTGYWWSPDASFIAYEEADHAGVETWYVSDPNRPGDVPRVQYYPRPGKKNVQVRLGVIPVSGGSTVWIEWDRVLYEYLAGVSWDKHGPLTLQVQDRKQKELLLLKADSTTGRTKRLLVEKDPVFLNIEPSMPRWLAGARAFLWCTKQSGKRVLQLHDADGRLSGAVLTGGDADSFQSLASVDDSTGTLYVTTSDSPLRNTLRRVSIPGRSGSTELIAQSGSGLLSAAFATNHSAFVVTQRPADTMPRTIVYTNPKSGTPNSRGELQSVAIEPAVRPAVTIEKLGGDAGFHTAVVKPRTFDSTRKYPVILEVYGGPHGLQVMPMMGKWLLTQWLADQGFLVASVDNRGTPGRGRDWERAIYQKFGSVPLEDQVKGLQLIAQKNPAIDLDRVGITGWSFGGYLSALAILKRPDVFKAAVAGAPVSSWEDYDTHYTERYLGLLPESQKAYDEASLLPLASNLERPLLLIHGTADDNVYFRHTLRFADALFRAGKDFTVLPLPSFTHMVPDPTVQERLWTRIADYFHKHLGEPK
jgi:dipeptidyl-peptidase-4